MNAALRRCARTKRALLTTGILVLVASLVCSAQAQNKPDAGEVKLSTALGPAYAQGKAGETWSALIREPCH